MTSPILSIKNLRTYFGSAHAPVRAVDDISFEVHPGETFALLGESGCGKSMTALSIMQLVPSPAGRILSGEIRFADRDLLTLSEAQMREVRGNQIAMIFQEPMTALNPVLSVGRQIMETLQQHRGLANRDAMHQAIELLDAVRIPDAKARLHDFPHQLSGGMKQRVMIALALACRPKLLIADEPTTALDVTIQAQVLNLIKELQRDTGMAVLMITHDLGIVADNVDRLAVMYAGQIVELAKREAFFSEQRHPYAKKLFAAVPSRQKRDRQLEVIKGNVPKLNREFSGCRFVDRCDYAWAHCRSVVPRWLGSDDHGVLCHLYDTQVASSAQSRSSKSAAEIVVESTHEYKPVDSNDLLRVRDLRVHFPIRKGLLKRTAGFVYAVDGIDLSVPAGRTVALVGESGCGKTTVAKAILRLAPMTAGQVEYQSYSLLALRGASLRRFRGEVQIIFQDPYSSMNPRMQVGEIIGEGLTITQPKLSDHERVRYIGELLEQVGMPTDAMWRYPHEFSGGQRQRICIARALAVKPKLIICDEPTSALDLSVQAQILNLLKQLQVQMGLSYLFITHNLTVVEYLAHEIAVMYLGRIVEYGPVSEVMTAPKHPYTQALLSAAPKLDREGNSEGMVVLEGEIPSAIEPPHGCYFHPRCPHVMPDCRIKYPASVALSDQHRVNCHLYSPAQQAKQSSG